MSHEILVNLSPHETRVAVIENGMVQEVHLERVRRFSYLGNIYKGRVTRVLPGMQAAFVDLGLERTAFLHAADIVQPSGSDDYHETPKISDLLHTGQEVVVQVIKDPIGPKGARLTTQLSIPSRYLVLLPGETNIGVSVRIEDEEERERLRQLVRDLMTAKLEADNNGELAQDANNAKPRRPLGWIVRTNAEAANEEALAPDLDYLNRLWKTIRRRIKEVPCGQCIYEDLSLPLRALRDHMHTDTERVRIDDEDIHTKMGEFAQQFIPNGAERLERYEGERPLFDLYGVEDEIQRALDRVTPLKSGGHIVIDQTEAMTTVDVNTGGFVGHRNLEETLFKTNLEAAQAIARQLRLRNLGGIIIIDFIDMQEELHREQVVKTLERALARDHARSHISSISPLGLVEMTRKRTTDSLANRLCEPCPTCAGSGRVKTIDTVCFEIFRDIMRAVKQFEARQLMVVASPYVIDKISEEHSTTVAELEERCGKPISLKPDEAYGQEQFDVVLY
ncbi:MAG: ribonuclease G [Xanthomonadales bacterium]|nr:ribonuclease G [Xanthomonadales bacterium]